MRPRLQNSQNLIVVKNHLKFLERVFQTPISGQIDWKRERLTWGQRKWKIEKKNKDSPRETVGNTEGRKDSCRVKVINKQSNFLHQVFVTVFTSIAEVLYLLIGGPLEFNLHPNDISPIKFRNGWTSDKLTMMMHWCCSRDGGNEHWWHFPE